MCAYVYLQRVRKISVKYYHVNIFETLIIFSRGSLRVDQKENKIRRYNIIFM